MKRSAWLLGQLITVLSTHFGIMIDAGSTSTTVFVYSWEFWDAFNTKITQINASQSPKFIHSVENVSEVLPIIRPLLEFAATQIPEEFVSVTTIYLKATAGMRALQATDPTKADATTSILRQTLSQTRFNFDVQRGLIMPGNQQAAFSWLAARHISGTSELVAAIDLGSISLSVSYVPSEPPLEGYFPFRVGEDIVDLYTHDFLGYGKDSAIARYHALASGRSVDPCLWMGASVGNLSGSGNFTACRDDVVSALFSSKVFCSVPPCSLDGVAAPQISPNTTVLAMNAFVPIVSFFGCKNAMDILSCLNENALRDCATLTYRDIISNHTTTSPALLVSLCFDAAFVLESLKALNISRIQFSNNKLDVGWALGAILYEIGLESVYYDTTVPSTDQSYGIVVDAGSTGSRCYVYSWRSRDFVDPDNFPVARQVATEYRVNPGLATLTSEGVPAYLQPCIDYTRPLVPAAQAKLTPIILMATAGMRVLYINNPVRAEGIMTATRALFARSGYLFEDQYVSILPGELEGAYAWLTVALLLKTKQDTCAIVDMGGSSTQLAFVPPTLPLASYVPVSIGSKSFDLYSHSYLFYGQNGATDRHREFLLARNSSNDPCGWKGYIHRDTVKGAVLPTTRTDFEECVATVRQQLLGLDVECSMGPCAINGVYSPRIPNDMKIYAFSGFTYLAEFFYTGYEASMQSLHDAARKLCESKDWATIKQERSSTPPEFVAPYCFAAAYFYTLMVDGYGVSTTKILYQYRYLSDNVIGFALGGLMYQVGLLHVELQPTPPPTPLLSSAPSSAPSLYPSLFPTPAPTVGPSMSSQRPSREPTKSPSRVSQPYSGAVSEDAGDRVWLLVGGVGLLCILAALGAILLYRYRLRRRQSPASGYSMVIN